MRRTLAGAVTVVAVSTGLPSVAHADPVPASRAGELIVTGISAFRVEQVIERGNAALWFQGRLTYRADGGDKGLGGVPVEVYGATVAPTPVAASASPPPPGTTASGASATPVSSGRSALPVPTTTSTSAEPAI